MNASVTIVMLIVLCTSCVTVEREYREGTTVYGSQALIKLHEERYIIG